MREYAGYVLGLENTETAQSGTGQITTFNQLGFSGLSDKPDGWYLPNEKHFPAIILEAKASDVKLEKHISELKKNCDIARTKYKKVIGILYNGYEVIVSKNGEIVVGETELRNKEYYFGLFEDNDIDTNEIYNITRSINNSLHFDFGIKNLYHRMIFTACALVAKRYGATLVKGMDYNTFHTSIHSTLAKSYSQDIKKNSKLNLLLDVYSSIQMNMTDNQYAIDNFIENVGKISDKINSDFWNGEDVMAIFFNEFNRYKAKSEHGQVFTPDNITSLMYRITETNKEDKVIDAACGSGSFLVKSMCNMMKEAGGVRTKKADEIKKTQLYGIELDKELFALACANMLIHKDGKTNIEQLDARSDEAKNWIKSKPITKVLMNPPFENKYGCIEIVANVLDSVERNTTCAFIMPDNKLETNINKARRILAQHRLVKIIKLPEKTFSGCTTSIFIFKAGIPQNGNQIFTCYIKDDGFETVKNQGRQDINNKWRKIEDYWVNIIMKQSGDESVKWINPNDALCYQMPEQTFQIDEADFKKTILDYVLYKSQIDEADFKIVIHKTKQ